MLVAFAVANTFDSVYNPDQRTENPIGGIIRASKRLIGLIGALLICASVAGQSPFVIVGGLGAFMAVFVLMFRDFLLGLVASVQIIANKVVKVGDWVTMPKYHADGDVQEISLTLIKVQNFDKTISTIPTNAILIESFRNWTGMQTAGGRRIKRAIFIDMHSIQVCTPEVIDRFEKIELIRDYIQQKKTELEEYNRTHDIDASTINSRRLTNIGTFRAYLEAYLRNHPGLREEMTFLVRHLQPTRNGLPIEIYAFCKETAWTQYEAIQADVFDHVLAILPEFGLQAFQDITDIEVHSAQNLAIPEWQANYTEASTYLVEQNRKLANRPNARVNAAVRRVEEKLKQLGISDDITVAVSERTLSLVWRATSGD
jgi:miniconductance mechanosensitive channel